jgi:hypothetical protein
MKQGKTEKAVFAKLSTEKVELASVSDLKSFVEKARGDMNAMVSRYMDAQDAARVGVASGEDHLANLKTVYNMMEDIKASAKELGIDLNSIPEYKLAYNFYMANPASASNKMIERMKGLL